MKIVNIHEAKTTLSALLAQVEQGEEVVIARTGQPIATLVGSPASRVREKGAWRRLPGWKDFHYDPAIFAPLSGEEIEAEGWV